MRTARPHISIKINTADEPTKVSGGVGTVHVQDCDDFLFPGLKAMGCEPISESVRFLDSPFTLKIKRINCKSIVAETAENSGKKTKVVLP